MSADAKSPARTYVILRGGESAPKVGEVDYWHVVARSDATSAAGALRGVEGLEGEGPFVAVPERFWRPVRRRTVEVKTVERFEAVS